MHYYTENRTYESMNDEMRVCVYVNNLTFSAGSDGQGSIHGRGKRFFVIPQRSNRLRGPTSLLSSGYWNSFPGCKVAERETENSSPSGAEVKNGAAIFIFTHTSSRRDA
jgi:hypothetical protein